MNFIYCYISYNYYWKIINIWDDCLYNIYFIEDCKLIRYKRNYDENTINERFYGQTFYE